MNPLVYVLGSVLLISAIANGWLKISNGNLQDDIVLLQLQATESAINNKAMKTSVEMQNSVIRNQEIDIAGKIKKLAEWKAKPVEIRYNTVYKTIPEYIDVTKTDCKTTKDIIGAIRTIDLNAI